MLILHYFLSIISGIRKKIPGKKIPKVINYEYNFKKPITDRGLLIQLALRTFRLRKRGTKDVVDTFGTNG